MSLSTWRLPKCLLTPLIETIGTPDGVGSTSFTSDPVVSMGADLTQGTPSLPRTRESAQSPRAAAPYHGAVTSMVTREATADQRRSPVRASRLLARALVGAHLPGPHLRLPDECARLRAAGRAAGGGRLPSARPTAPTPTSSCSTPARCARTPTTSCTATSATSRRASRPTPTCRSPSAAAWRRRTATRCCSKAPWVDVVFGTHNIGSLPTLLDRARHNRAAQVEIVEALEEFPSALPAARESAYAAWVSISVGCNNTCTFCIVPALRGKEVDRRPGDVLAEVQSLVDQGVLEVTLLGPERQRLRRLLRRPRSAARPRRVRQAAAGVRAHRRAGAGAVHLAAPRRVHRRRHRGDGRDAECLPGPAHAAAVGVGPDAAGHAPLVPRRALPRHHRPGARRHPARRDHHRPDRRLPRRDRGGLPGHARRGRRRRGSPARSRSSTRSGPARRPPSSTGSCRKPLCRNAISG